MDAVRIKRIEKDLPLPEYHTDGAVGFDLYSRITTQVAPGEIAIIPANLIVEIPKGYMLALCSRSSTPRKKGLTTPHGIGVIDQDYHGEEDELGIQVYNFTKEPVHIERGERIAQAVFLRVGVPEFTEVETMKAESRGGFGSTGHTV